MMKNNDKAMKKNKKVRIPMLLCMCFLAIASLAFGGITLSSYLTKGEGEDSAKVAAIAMDSSAEFVLERMKPGWSENITFEVTNYSGEGAAKAVSEVAQEYTITIGGTNNLPLVYTLKCSDDTAGGNGIELSKEQSGTQLTWGSASGVGTLPPSSDAKHTYVLTATWPTDKNAEYLSDEIDLITVTVDAVQID